MRSERSISEKAWNGRRTPNKKFLSNFFQKVGPRREILNGNKKRNIGKFKNRG
jgi:hypothetical protein